MVKCVFAVWSTVKTQLVCPNRILCASEKEKERKRERDFVLGDGCAFLNIYYITLATLVTLVIHFHTRDSYVNQIILQSNSIWMSFLGVSLETSEQRRPDWGMPCVEYSRQFAAARVN